jgi:NitT/TauT family transport system ATP-binding protein
MSTPGQINVSAQPGSPLCEVRHVSQEFPQPQGQPLRVLENIDLQIRANEVVALLGPSGCGKSTLLRILAGLLVPTRGEVLYHGNRLDGLNPGVAIVFQSFALYPWMTVMENVEAVLNAAGLSRGEAGAQAAQAIRTVGLAGFEEAYPRELSGGMKQRVGMARAFSLNPEMLFMDEPFSQVDALTAESLRAEVIDIWTSKDKKTSSILIVSHDIKEVVYMADRIVVMGAHPGVVKKIVENTLPRPRDYRSPALLQLVDQLHDIITGIEMPDVPAAVPEAVAIEPLPHVGPGEILGLLEYLDARGGQEEVFRIASDTQREFGTLINVVNAAEMLDLVETPKRLVRLAPEGIRMVRAQIADRKVLWRQRILTLGLFQQVVRAIERSPDGEVTKEFVLENIVLAMPLENYEAIFETFVKWGRFADLFDYDEEREVFRAFSGSEGEIRQRQSGTG